MNGFMSLVIGFLGGFAFFNSFSALKGEPTIIIQQTKTITVHGKDYPCDWMGVKLSLMPISDTLKTGAIVDAACGDSSFVVTVRPLK